MVKKAPRTKKAGKAPKPKKAAVAPKPRSKPRKSKEAKPPRQPSFQGEGFDRVRNPRLDELCEDIGDARERLAKAGRDEDTAISKALELMTKLGAHKYQHQKVELVLKEGKTKLSVRVLKDIVQSGGDLPSDAGGKVVEPKVAPEHANVVDDDTPF